MRKIQYCTVKQELRVYEYDKKYKRSKRNIKPKCPNCTFRLRYISFRNNQKHKKLGYYCLNCKFIFLFKKTKVFKIDNNKSE